MGCTFRLRRVGETVSRFRAIEAIIVKKYYWINIIKG